VKKRREEVLQNESHSHQCSHGLIGSISFAVVASEMIKPFKNSHIVSIARPRRYGTNVTSDSLNAEFSKDKKVLDIVVHFRLSLSPSFLHVASQRQCHYL